MVVTLRSRPHAIGRIVCFPWAGAGTAAFASWIRLLPERFDLLAVRLPGRESDISLPPCNDLSGAALQIARSLSHRDLKSTALFGHSLGAWLALETAVQLEREYTRPVGMLVVSGAPPPGSCRRAADDDGCQVVRRAVAEAHQPAIPGEADELMEAALARALYADVAMADDYAATSRTRRLASPIAAYAGRADIGTTELGLQKWQAYTSHSLVVRWFAGGHWFVKERAREVVGQLASDIGNCQNLTSGSGH